MNSDLIPSSQASNSNISEPTLSETGLEDTKMSRQQPIPPPSEPMQYRAIGLVRGIYQASAEQFTQGTLVATDGTELRAALLGRIISLVKNHLDLEQEHLWVVYPRTGQKKDQEQEQDQLHLQIVGVWEPEKLSKELLATARPQLEEAVSEEDTATPTKIEDGYFSVRGEVVYQSAHNNELVVKIKQAPRKESDKPKYFKLKLQGVIKFKAVGQFWDFQIQRQADNLVIQQSEAIAVLPKPQRPQKRTRPYQSRTPNLKGTETSRPIRKQDGPSSAVTRPIHRPPTPKPTKRPKPPQE